MEYPRLPTESHSKAASTLWQFKRYLIFMMTKKENAKADFIKDLAEKMSREICDNSELNEKEAENGISE